MPARDPCAYFGPRVLRQIWPTLNRAGTLQDRFTDPLLPLLVGTDLGAGALKPVPYDFLKEIRHALSLSPGGLL
jgi:hypothetical protein